MVGHSSVRRVRMCQTLMAVLQAACWSVAAVNVVLNLARPASPAFPSSIVTDAPGLVCTAGRFILIALQGYLLLCWVNLMLLCTCPMILLIFSLPEILQRQM